MLRYFLIMITTSYLGYTDRTAIGVYPTKDECEVQAQIWREHTLPPTYTIGDAHSITIYAGPTQSVLCSTEQPQGECSAGIMQELERLRHGDLDNNGVVTSRDTLVMSELFKKGWREETPIQ
jgi:hypothetical protein